MDHVFEAELELPVPLTSVFPFFADAANLERITPPELGFSILTPLPIAMGEGALIEYRIRLFGLPLRWTTLITAWDPPHRFVDEQLSGPYALWVHTHSFVERGSSTVIYDHVRYRLPLSPLGDIALPLVKRQIGRIFAYREKAVKAAVKGVR